MNRIRCLVIVWGISMLTNVVGAETISLRLQSRLGVSDESTKSDRRVVEVVERKWDAQQTAVIVCDVWDAHHCLNAVRRLEEFAPRLNDVLKAARKRGATIIHSPSDCMAAYEDHAARKRAIAAPTAKSKPKDVEHWCSRIPNEEQAIYPIDQSDGGEDDDPAEHAEWAAQLKAMGRNPGMPWKTQSKLIEIDAERDFISDRGDEVWNVLESRGIKNVILVGVHLNMCVLGRPFGLRQMVRNGKNVALMRDMTDCMYNPKRWPQVDHFTGNDLVIAHVERFICPTITSDQLLGGEPFRSKYDTRKDQVHGGTIRRPYDDWVSVPVPSGLTFTNPKSLPRVAWYRCIVRLPKNWTDAEKIRLKIADTHPTRAWLNGHESVVKSSKDTERGIFQFSPESFLSDDYNLLVLRIEARDFVTGVNVPPMLVNGSNMFELKGRWQFRFGDDKSWSNIPLPAKFGGSTDMLFELAR